MIEEDVIAIEIQRGMMNIEKGIIDIGDQDQDHRFIEAIHLMIMILAPGIEIIREEIIEKDLIQNKNRGKMISKTLN